MAVESEGSRGHVTSVQVPLGQGMIVGVYSVILVFGVIGNAFVFAAIIQRRNVRSILNFYLTNIAASDLVLLLITIPVNVYLLFKSVVDNVQLFDFMKFMTTTCILVTSFSLVAIVTTRYFIIVNPVSRAVTRTTSLLSLVVIWIISVSTAVPYALCVFERKSIFCSVYLGNATWFCVYSGVLVSLLFVFPGAVCIFFLYKSHRAITFNPREMEALNRTAHAQHQVGYERGLARNLNKNKMMILMTSFHILLWLPFTVVGFLWTYGVYIDHMTLVTAHVLAMFTSAGKPMLYLVYGESKLGTALKDFITAFCRKCLCEGPTGRESIPTTVRLEIDELEQENL